MASAPRGAWQLRQVMWLQPPSLTVGAPHFGQGRVVLPSLLNDFFSARRVRRAALLTMASHAAFE